jgi:hypothetical protein
VEYLFEAHGLVNDLHVKHLLEQPRPNFISSTLHSRLHSASAHAPSFISVLLAVTCEWFMVYGSISCNVPFI